MAANSNYYGYSAGVQGAQVYGNAMQSPQMTQSAYSGQTTAAYGAQSTTPSANAYGTASPRSVMPAQSAYTPTAASSYQTTGLSGSSYGYTARVQDSTSQSYQTNAATAYTSPSSYYGRDNSQASTGYDASKTGSYYNQHSGTTQGYGYGSPATKSMYSGYSAPSNTSNQMTTPSAQKPSTSAATNVNVSYPYKGQAGTNYNQNSSSYTSPSNWSGSGGGYQQTQGYDAAVYNAASSYFQQQTQPRQKWGNNKNNSNNNQTNKSGPPRQRNPPRQQQVHYCDVCKISCAGPQTYKEHLEGQKHKKKEAAQKQMEAVGADGYRCSLCDVTCTGTDAFNAHLKGAKHLKTVKLHEKLGKPIPEVLSAEAQDKDKKKDGTVKPQTPKPSFRNNQRRNRKPSAPKITFIGGTTLNTSTGETTTTAAAAAAADTPETPDAETAAVTPDEGEKKSETPASEEGKESKFVGEDYVEEVKSDAGKVIGFECKLCECKFNDTLAREAHLKGRRHQLTYKKKVQPDYVVDQKPSTRSRQPPQPRSLMDDKARRRWEQDMYWRQQEAAWRNEEVRRWGEEEYWRRLEEEERMWEEQESHRHGMEWGHRMGPQRPDFLPPDMYPPPNMARPRQDSQDDRLVMAKHKQIYPNEQELSAVQSIVSAVEKALKLVSDCIAEEEAPVKTEVKEEEMEVSETPAEEKTEEGDQEKADGEKAEGEEKAAETEEEKKPEETKKPAAAKPKEKIEQTPPRTLKGVMRVGVLAKGLLLHERLNVQLVVLCQDRPTTRLLERVSTKLPEQLTKVSDEKYDVVVDACVITVTTSKEPSITVLITLTSPVMRDEAETAQAEEQKDVLDRDKCLEALASLRHAKWFQAKANGVPSCVVIIRILRDMRDRLPVFTPLNSWSLELLVEKCLSSAEQPLGPGEAFRRVLECISSGFLLPGGPGLHDPCEKEVTDASKEMTAQEREDLTATAQNYLRLQAFRQLHKVLGIERLPPSSKFRGGRYGRGGRFKRRREDSGQGDGSAKKEKKDGEEEGEEESKDAEGTAETTIEVAATTTEDPVEDKPAEPAVAEATS